MFVHHVGRILEMARIIVPHFWIVMKSNLDDITIYAKTRFGELRLIPLIGF